MSWLFAGELQKAMRRLAGWASLASTEWTWGLGSSLTTSASKVFSMKHQLPRAHILPFKTLSLSTEDVH